MAPAIERTTSLSATTMVVTAAASLALIIALKKKSTQTSYRVSSSAVSSMVTIASRKIRGAPPALSTASASVKNCASTKWIHDFSQKRKAYSDIFPHEKSKSRKCFTPVRRLGGPWATFKQSTSTAVKIQILM